MTTNPNLASFFDTLLSDPRFYRPKSQLSAQVYPPDRTRDQFWFIAQRRTRVGVMYYNQKLSPKLIPVGLREQLPTQLN
jgi:hypothetical protein